MSKEENKATEDAKKDEPAANDSHDDKKVGEFKRGDYMIHVFIQKGKKFILEDENSINALIQVSCNGETKYCKPHPDVICNQVDPLTWDEHIFFEPKNMEVDDISATQIEIKVLNKGFLKDEMVGMYEFDISSIYFRDKHCFEHQYVGLSNPDAENFSEIKGLLKMSISVMGPGDEQVQLKPQSGPEDPNAQFLLSSAIKKEFKQLKLRFLKAQQLPIPTGLFESMDPIIVCEFMGKKISTKSVPLDEKANEAEIDQEFWLPMQVPLTTSRLILKVLDDNIMRDDILGTMTFNLRKLMEDGEIETKNRLTGEKETGSYFWKNLYGCPHEYDNDAADRMNQNPEVATTWKGRILMHVEVVDEKSPIKKVQEIDEKIKEGAIQQGFYTEDDYQIFAEVSSGISLPEDKKYTVRIKIADYQIQTKLPKEQKGDYNRWSEQLDSLEDVKFKRKQFKCPYNRIVALEKVFVYLMDDDKPICYWKGDINQKEFTDPMQAKFRWLPLKADKAIDEVDEDFKAGMIQLKLTIHRITGDRQKNMRMFDPFKSNPPKRLDCWTIRAYIFQCKDIPAADDDGSSDCYISIWNPDNKEIKTKIIEDNLNPIYMEALEFEYDFNDKKDAPPIILNLWDHDDGILDSDDDFLGRCVVPLDQAAVNDENKEEIPTPKWYDVKIGFDENSPATGQVLCSFAIVKDYAFNNAIEFVSPASIVETKEYTVSINVLGLRELESQGLLPVRKAFIKFNNKSLLPPEKAMCVSNSKSEPKEMGSNPNINCVLEFSLNLPVEELYCPALSCAVYDQVFMGFSQPLLGTFTIEIGRIMQQKRAERAEQINVGQKELEILKDKLDSLNNQGSLLDKSSDISQIVPQIDPFKLKKQAMELNQKKKSISTPKSKGKVDTISKSIKDKAKKDYQRIHDEERKNEKESKSVKRLETQKELKKSGVAADVNVLLPKYDYDNTLKVYREKDKPNEDLFMQIGFNTQEKITEYDQASLQPVKKKTIVKIVEENKEPESGQNNQTEQPLASQHDRSESQASDAALAFTNLNKNFAKQLTAKSLDAKEGANKKAEIKRNLQVGTKKKEITDLHYRKYYEDELENVKEIFQTQTFLTVDIKRGQQRGNSKSWFSSDKEDESGQVNTIKSVGKFKGMVNVYNEEIYSDYKSDKKRILKEISSTLQNIYKKTHNEPMPVSLREDLDQDELSQLKLAIQSIKCDRPQLLGFLTDLAQDKIIQRQLMTFTQATVRLYLLEGYDMAQRDIGSDSDPYAYIECGTKVFNEQNNYQIDEPNPKFYKMYEMKGEFPGNPNIVIKIFDYDFLFGDELIGKTSIDLDDRFFCSEWQSIQDKPIEYRQLYHPCSDMSQGVVKLWVDIETQQEDKKSTEKVWDITQEPEKDVEVRLCIFDTLNIPCMDVEGTSDVFIKACFDEEEVKETDTHWRCQNGKASFNYRILFDMKVPRKDYKLTLTAFDRDLLKSNDVICAWHIDLSAMFEDVRLTQKSQTLSQSYFDSSLKQRMPEGSIKEWKDKQSFWLEAQTVEEDKKLAKVRCDIRILPKTEAEKQKVGAARSEPNQEPFLSPPVGRIQFSMNPCTMYRQLVGPAMRRKICCFLCCILCVTLCVMLLPMVIGDLISTGITNTLSGGD